MLGTSVASNLAYKSEYRQRDENEFADALKEAQANEQRYSSDKPSLRRTKNNSFSVRY